MLGYAFPAVPQWTAWLFPTCRIIGPVMEISRRGGAWPDVAVDLYVPIGVILALLLVATVVARGTRLRQA